MFAADFMHFFPIMPAIVENKIEMRKNFSGAGGLLTNPLLKNVIKGIKYASYLGFTADFRVFAWGRPWNPIRVFPTGEFLCGLQPSVGKKCIKSTHVQRARPARCQRARPAGRPPNRFPETTYPSGRQKPLRNVTFHPLESE